MSGTRGTGAFSRGLHPDGGGGIHLPSSHPPSISPSDEAAARLADVSGSASFGDLRSALLASTGNTMPESSSSQRRTMSKTTKENEGRFSVKLYVLTPNPFWSNTALVGCQNTYYALKFIKYICTANYRNIKI